MSMLSAQCDKLRERAKELRSLAPDPAVPYLVPSTKETMALAMRSAASEMEDAADTIWELRGMVHKERAEADRMREELDHWHVEQVHAYGNWEDAYRHAAELEAERDKLRELVRDYYMFEHGDCRSCRYHDECRNDESCRCIAPMRLADRTRELRVEVD